ncbi:hemolysin-type calcium-binding repeat 2 copies family protein [Asticcacaulis biprosthecium C19]|uniref:Hemolysin-type calcium-binding repeat 2 copies family protein n=1 Tax=Asticcacaulis biprosthecium C19 TaxID=715226 RepID=F4QRD2_9CAUL|nr:S8 family serine peptidase [Asticcacaulis biprosthecium]EGF90769.1 hemolysin-type calcium-binding repeat 2 copies family protein [Asticcacaulis biprosthecium C19]
MLSKTGKFWLRATDEDGPAKATAATVAAGIPNTTTGAGPRPGDDPLLYRQWYIDKTGLDDIGIDMNVRPVWEGGGGTGYTGAGVTVGVFDSLIERNHPDLEANYNESLNVEDLFYEHTDSAHGTAVAGIIAAAKNGIGMTGIAYDSKVTSLPVIYTTAVSMQSFEIAMSHAKDFDIANFSLGGLMPFDSGDVRGWFQLHGHHYKDAVDLGRDGLGTLLIQAAGNNRGINPLDANLSNFQNQRYSITVSAVDSWGLVADYSSEGANVLVAAASSGSYYGPHIATTDMVGDGGYNKGDNPDWDPVSSDYTTRFGGTSAAAPVISGVTALILEANPELGWRDVRDILAFSARHTGAAFGETPAWHEGYGWKINHSSNVNGTGLHYNQNYGFGLVDALAAVRLAESWTRQRTSANEISRSDSFTQDTAIPEGPYNTTPLVIEFDIEAGVTAQIVTLSMNMIHKMSNELQVKLISPSGTESLIFDHKGFGPSIYGTGGTAWAPWTFTSNNFVGEDPTGTWRLEILDDRGFWPTNGVFKTATLTVYGDAPTNDSEYIYTNEFGVLAGMDYGFTIIDTAGIDTLNAAAVTAAAVLDLRGIAPAVINGMAVTIAPGTLIEHAWGGDGGDVFHGNGAANRLNGMRGSDTIHGGAGDDTLSGGAGDDYVHGGAGNDELSGGDGIDRLSYEGATTGVTVDLSLTTGQETGAGLDKLFGFEVLQGSGHDDRLTGSAASNVISAGGGHDTVEGGDGNDTLVGGAGGDRLNGGAGVDRLSYADSVAGVRVLLTANVVTGLPLSLGGHAQGDVIDGFEDVTGGSGNDTLGGDNGDNRLTGGGGHDALLGEAGDDDLDGGAGDDALSGGVGNDQLYGRDGNDNLAGAEGHDTVDGGGGHDVVSGGDGDDRVSGGDGHDMVGGRAGNDYLDGGLGNDTVFGGDGDDGAYGRDGDDNLSGELGRDTLDGGSGNDTLSGGGDDDRLSGGLGSDQIRGGSGNDVFVYRQADVMATGDAHAAADMLLDFLPRAHPYQQYDRIDLRAIDAIDGGANDAFVFIGDAAFTAAGQLRAWFDGVNTRVEGNTVSDTDGHVEFEVLLQGNLASTIGVLDFFL